MGASFTGWLPLPNSVVLLLQVDFVPIAIETGIITKMECYIGATGGRFEIDSTNAVLENLTADERDQVERTVRTESEVAGEFEPHVSATTGIDLSFGSAGKRKLKSVEETRTIIEAWLTGTYSEGRRRIHWSRPQTDELLERNYFLVARACWDGEPPAFSSTAKPSDRRFFGPNRKALPRMASLALCVRFVLAGNRLPGMSPLCHSLPLAPRKTDE